MEVFLFKILPLTIVFLLTYWYVRYRFQKGAVGEREVKRTIHRNIRQTKYIINNLIIKNGDKTAELDHVLITNNGIFVIETKNLSGQVYGTENRREWTQVLSYGKAKYPFYNPIMQNNTHITALKRLLKLKDGVYSIVVFPRAVLMNKLPDYVGGLNNMIKEINRKYEILFSDEEIKNIYQKLVHYKNTTSVSRRKHIRNVKKTQHMIKQNKCPRCGADLIKREGKYGAFYGCTNYPQCTFTKGK